MVIELRSGIAIVAHVLTVFVLVAGIVGRDLVYRRAARTDDLATLRAMVDLGGVFERGLVRPLTFVVLLSGLWAAWWGGWPILGFLQGARENWVLASLLVYLSIVPVIAFVFLPRGRVFRAALDGAIAAGRVTPELRAALHDPAVHAARVYEGAMIVALTALMVLRPI